MRPADIERVFGRQRLKMTTGEHVDVFREQVLPGERRRYTKRFLSTHEGDFRHWTEREWRILARLIGHGIGVVPEVVQFDRGSSERPALVQTYDAGITVDHWATLLPVERDGRVRRHVFEDCAHWWALARHCLMALDAIHELDLVHLDLKADNVCIPCAPPDFDPSVPDQPLRPMFEQIALIDFAFALVSGERLTHALPIGHQAEYEYQSPRLLHALEAGRAGNLQPTRELDWRCDIFSLAAMLDRYLPPYVSGASGERGGWNDTRHRQAQSLVCRLFDAHHGLLPSTRPHRQLIAFTERVLSEPELASSLERGWLLALDTDIAPLDTPTPVTRIAAPIVAIPPDLLPSPIALRPAPQRRAAAVPAWLWAAGAVVAGGVATPLLGEAWHTWEASRRDAPLMATAAPARNSRMVTPAVAPSVMSDTTANRPAAVSSPVRVAQAQPAAVEGPASAPAAATVVEPVREQVHEPVQEPTHEPSKAIAPSPAPTQHPRAVVVAPRPVGPAAPARRLAAHHPRSVAPPAKAPLLAKAGVAKAAVSPRLGTTAHAAPAAHPAVVTAAPAPAPPFAAAARPAVLPAATPAAPPTAPSVALVSASPSSIAVERPIDNARAAVQLSNDFSQRADELLSNVVPRIAQHAERLVLRVLHVAAEADGAGRDLDVREAAHALRGISDDTLAGLGVSSDEAHRLKEAAATAFWSERNPRRAAALQARAFGADPFDADAAGDLAFYLLKQRPAPAETARELALYALTASHADVAGGRLQDWTTFAIASALTGRQRDASNALFVTLALADSVDRPCRSALAAYASHGERLRAPTEAMLYRVRAWGRSNESSFCRWPPSWSVGMRVP